MTESPVWKKMGLTWEQDGREVRFVAWVDGCRSVSSVKCPVADSGRRGVDNFLWKERSIHGRRHIVDNGRDIIVQIVKELTIGSKHVVPGTTDSARGFMNVRVIDRGSAWMSRDVIGGMRSDRRHGRHDGRQNTF